MMMVMIIGADERGRAPLPRERRGPGGLQDLGDQGGNGIVVVIIIISRSSSRSSSSSSLLEAISSLKGVRRGSKVSEALPWLRAEEWGYVQVHRP